MEWSLAPVNIPTIRAPTPTPGVSSAPRVRQALVHAASGISTRDAKQRVLSVDMRPLVIHLLDGLHRAGLERAVVCLGENASAVEHAVQTHAPKIKVDYVYSPPSLWRNLANSIIAARTAFPGSEPLLVLRADQLYDWRVLRRIADAPFSGGGSASGGLDAFALVDTTPQTLEWASGVYCSDSCRGGRCQALCKVLRDPNGRAVRCSHQLRHYDAVVAGDVYATRPKIFEVLGRLFQESIYTTIADAMGDFAAAGALGCVEVGTELSAQWFASKTVAAVFRQQAARQAAVAAGGGAPGHKRTASGSNAIPGRVSIPHEPNTPWQHVVNAAREQLAGVTQSPALVPTAASRELLPRFQLGPMLGKGANCTVVEAEADPDSSENKDAPRGLAVKMFESSGHDQEGLREVMWEVHVLRHLRHEHIVRLCDVVEVADAVYVVMERVDGPDLKKHIASQPGGKLSEAAARHLFGHLLAALRHAHSRGFVHCDVKPENVRLSVNCDRAVVVDWGLARQLSKQRPHIAEGSPAYASPEQLTGVNTDEIGRPKLQPAADVWSLGATLYEMLVGRPPFGDGTGGDCNSDTFDALVERVLRLNYDLPDALSVDARRLIDSMLQVQPADRASVAELCNDRWVVADGPLPPDEGAVAFDACVECEEEPRSALDFARTNWRRVGLALLYLALAAFALAQHHASKKNANATQPQDLGALADDIISK